MGIVPTTSRFYSHTSCRWATTGLLSYMGCIKDRQRTGPAPTSPTAAKLRCTMQSIIIGRFGTRSVPLQLAAAPGTLLKCNPVMRDLWRQLGVNGISLSNLTRNIYHLFKLQNTFDRYFLRFVESFWRLWSLFWILLKLTSKVDIRGAYGCIGYYGFFLFKNNYHLYDETEKHVIMFYYM